MRLGMSTLTRQQIAPSADWGPGALSEVGGDSDKAVDRRGVIGHVISQAATGPAGRAHREVSCIAAQPGDMTGQCLVASCEPRGGSGRAETGRGGATLGEGGGMSLARMVLNQ